MDTFQIATEGINPNWSPWLIALRGFGFDVEVIITPTKPNDTGGSWGPDRTVWETAHPYTITVRIKYKNKVWEQNRPISSLSVRSLEKVTASFRRITTNIVSIYSKFKNIISTKVSVKIKRR